VPNNASARKRVRQTATRRARNRWRKTSIREQIKSFQKAVRDHDLERAEAEFRKACGLLDKVATTSTMHRNTAARRKSRMSRRLKALKTAG